MSLAQGSLSFTRYRLLGKPANESIKRLNQLLAPYRLGAFDLSGKAKVEVVGFVKPTLVDDAIGDDAWDMSHAQTNDGFLLRMRYEKRNVPSPLLQEVFKASCQKHQRATGKWPSPKERRDMKDKLKHDLLSKTLPHIAYVDAYWRERANELIVFSTGKKLVHTFEQIFAAAFANELELQLLPMRPPATGWHTLEDAADESAWDETIRRVGLTTPVTFCEFPVP